MCSRHCRYFLINSTDIIVMCVHWLFFHLRALDGDDFGDDLLDPAIWNKSGVPDWPEFDSTHK